jgi:ribonuclease Z
VEQISITLLGTAATKPTRSRSCSANLVKIGGKNILLDAGEGAQKGLLQWANLGANSLDAVILTHYHADHYLGLASIVKTRAGHSECEPLPIYCLPTNEPLLRAYLDATMTHPSLYALETIEPGDSLRLGSEWTALFYAAVHTSPALSIVFEEDVQPPRLNAGKALADGATFGPDMKILARGEDLTLDDGRVLRGQDYLLAPQPGRRWLYTGDTAWHEGLSKMASSCSLIVSEATYLEQDRDKAEKNGHMTAGDAGKLGASAGTPVCLVLNHLSSRYTPDDVLTEASAVAGDSVKVVIGEDGYYCGP